MYDIYACFDSEYVIVKGTIMQIEKALINDRLCVSKVSCKFCIPTICNFVGISL